jgi:hypothetical protein
MLRMKKCARWQPRNHLLKQLAWIEESQVLFIRTKREVLKAFQSSPDAVIPSQSQDVKAFRKERVTLSLSFSLASLTMLSQLQEQLMLQLQRVKAIRLDGMVMLVILQTQTVQKLWRHGFIYFNFKRCIVTRVEPKQKEWTEEREEGRKEGKKGEREEEGWERGRKRQREGERKAGKEEGRT